jgi:hypothetical protein
MNKIAATTAVIIGLLVVGLSAHAGVFGNVLAGTKSHTPLSFAERWSPVNDAMRSGAFVAQSDETVF